MMILPSQGISIQSVIELINACAVVIAILGIGFSLVGEIAVWWAGKDGARDFFRMFERLQVLQLLTVLTNTRLARPR